MNQFYIVIIVLSGCLALYVSSGYFLGRRMARKFSFSKSKSLSFTYQACLENAEYTKEEFAGYNFTDFSVESDFGYTLRGVFSAGTNPEKTVIFAHGHTWTWHGMVKYFPAYVKRGYTIVAYNHRYHGDSGGECCTAGFYEKSDLLKIADWTFARFPETKIFGAMGESLGAATVLQYLPMDKRLTFAHADCPYSDAVQLYQHQMNRYHLPSFLKRIAIYFCNHYFKHKCGFSLHQVSPIRDFMQSSIPLLLVHGANDTYVPTGMSVDLAKKRQDHAPTTLLIIEGAAHAKSLAVNPVLYTNTLDKFLDKAERI
ncbi:MAG: alpha/beta hydrolase [Spirochaetia bacterium]|nr:alpha/beta hydrolase [Spirochaetia bacterium]